MTIKRRDDETWYKLDLSATVYPTLQSRRYSAIYRIRARLTKPVDPKLMQQALDLALPRFPTFKTAMRKGLFWRYLEPNDRPGPFIQEDIRNSCLPLPFHACNRYLVRLYYYDRSVSLEMHHSLADGTGGMCLMQTMLAQYLKLQGVDVPPEGFVFDIDAPADSAEIEDAYRRYATARVKPPRKSDPTYLMHGTAEDFYTLNTIIGVAPVSEVIATAKRYGGTVTEYLCAALLQALLQVQREEHRRKELPVRLAMPVNLRRFFPSVTVRNFISMVYPCIDPRLGEYTFAEIVDETRGYLRYYVNSHFLRGDITKNSSTERNPASRITPLFIKDLAISTAYRFVQNRNSSAGITNMGNLAVPDAMRPYIEQFDICMGQPYSRRTNCSIISYNDRLTMNFSSTIIEADVERYFFRQLVRDGIHVLIESNKEYPEDTGI